MTFAELDKTKGYSPLPEKNGGEYPLPAWYREVYRVPLEKLTVFDLSRACRQRNHLEEVVPAALRVLANDPSAGDLYEGDLAAALVGLPKDYWDSHREQRAELCRICATALEHQRDDLGEDLVKEIANFVEDTTDDS